MIQILDSKTIDKIAAGEVIERPASVVKELVENAMDAGASAISVEVKDGGISFLRISDNGCGIPKEELRTAFYRHATSKIIGAEDLFMIKSLGFRGEALSSIAAVSRVEVITKTKEALCGVHMAIEGGAEKYFEEIGAPTGSTFLVRDLFYNTPVRRKFLKQPATEGSYIAALMERFALSRPDIAFQLLMNGKPKFFTSGNGDLKEVIYRIYGREIAASLVPIEVSGAGILLEGYLGKPALTRSGRGFEFTFLNTRIIKSAVVNKAIEEGYQEYLMQHKFPFCVLHITLDAARVDVNVHPTKSDVRFDDAAGFSAFLTRSIHDALHDHEMMPDVYLDSQRERQMAVKEELAELYKAHAPEPFEVKRWQMTAPAGEAETSMPAEDAALGAASEAVSEAAETSMPTEGAALGAAEGAAEEAAEETAEGAAETSLLTEGAAMAPAEAAALAAASIAADTMPPAPEEQPDAPAPASSFKQLNLFEERIISQKNRDRYRIVGQVFGTYWMVEFEDKLFMIDQHAAHEKVKFETFMARFHNKEILSQNLLPPLVITLSAQEEQVLLENLEAFQNLGFAIEPFGDRDYALRSVPVDLYGCSEQELFVTVLDDLIEHRLHGAYSAIEEKIASMSCKAAVKGGNVLSFSEAQALIDALLALDNPYNCPHGRPAIVVMSKYEMDKKFKRIVN